MVTISTEIKKLRKDIDKLIDKYLQKITSIILKAIKNYPSDWNIHYKKIENLFYDFLTEIYNIVNKYLKYIYNDLPEFDVKDIFDLAYDIDGKKITDRLKEYWDEVASRIEDEETTVDVSHYLINMYDRILFTESRVVESKLIEAKKPNNASLLVIEAGCEKCSGGEYPPGENVDLPPFHPNCNCIHYYEIANEDDVHDLDLEEDELA